MAVFPRQCRKSEGVLQHIAHGNGNVSQYKIDHVCRKMNNPMAVVLNKPNTVVLLGILLPHPLVNGDMREKD
jgi:predicted aconitase with swiveling domain